MAQSAAPTIPYSAARDESRPRVPWYIWCGLLGPTSIVLGLYWDISWHMSIGRDTFWTPAHMAIQLGGILVALTSVYLIFSTTFGNNPAAKAASIRVWGFRGPLGAFLACWGGVVMVTSAPFDNWWHNSFGLDVSHRQPAAHGPRRRHPCRRDRRAATTRQLDESRRRHRANPPPPHVFPSRRRDSLAPLGAALRIHRRQPDAQPHVLSRACPSAVPIILIALSRAGGYRWGATVVAAIYTAWVLGQLWLLPLFPATPKLGPVFTNITHMVPLEFPTLIIIPAIALDFLLNRYANKNKWTLAVMLGAAYLAVLLLVHWPLGDFLISPAARNWVFGQNYFPYMESPSEYHYQLGIRGPRTHHCTISVRHRHRARNFDHRLAHRPRCR